MNDESNYPPLQTSGTEPEEEQFPLPREHSWFEKTGTWLIVAFVFAFLLVSKVYSDSVEKARAEVPGKVAEYNGILRQSGKTERQKYVLIANRAELLAKTDPVAAQVLVAANTLLKKPVPKSLYKFASDQEDSVLADCVTYLSGRHAKLPLTKELTTELIPFGKVGNMMMLADRVTQVGSPYKTDPLGEVPQSLRNSFKLGVGILVLLVLMGGFSLFVFLVTGEGSTFIKSSGHPFAHLSPEDSGGMMALKGTLILFLFMLISVPVMVIWRDLPSSITMLISSILSLTGIITFLLVSKVYAHLRDRFVPKSLQLLFAFGAFVPMLLITAAIVATLMQLGFGTVGGSHPIAEQAKQSGLLEFISAFVMAVIVAPILEEVIFRGYIFGGMQRSGMKLIWAGVVSSLMFGLIHPQNWAVVFGLAFIGFTMAMVATVTRSLYSAMILHALLNGMIILMTYGWNVSQ